MVVREVGLAWQEGLPKLACGVALVSKVDEREEFRCARSESRANVTLGPVEGGARTEFASERTGWLFGRLDTRGVRGEG